MTSAIVKTFFGKHIDLDKIIAISDVRSNAFGHYSFTIEFQLRDTPMVIEDLFMFKEEAQKKVDELIQQWKDYEHSKTIY